MVKLGRKFIFGIVSILCVSGVSAYLKYNGEVYLKLVGAIAGLFLTSQTIIDTRKEKQ